MELTFGWDRAIDEQMAALDLSALLAWMRGIETSWELAIPGAGSAVIGVAVPSPLASPLDALVRRLAERGTIADATAILDAHADRYGEIAHPATWTSRGLGERAEYSHALRTRVMLAPDPESAALAEDAASIGQTGCAGVWQWAADLQDPRRIADRMAIELGLTPLGVAWAELTAERAHRLLALAIHEDLAYGAKREDEPTARERATQWLLSAGAGAHLLTNGTWSDNFSGASNPIGSATFDLAFATVGPERCALVWIGDED